MNMFRKCARRIAHVYFWSVQQRLLARANGFLADIENRVQLAGGTYVPPSRMYTSALKRGRVMKSHRLLTVDYLKCGKVGDALF